MKSGSSRTLVGFLLLACIWPSVAQPAAALGATPTSHQVTFRNDDLHAARIARKVLRKEFGQEEAIPSGSSLLWTAWVDVSRARPPALFVMDGCSPTGNCGLYGFESTKNGWKLILNSVAQTC